MEPLVLWWSYSLSKLPFECLYFLRWLLQLIPGIPRLNRLNCPTEDCLPPEKISPHEFGLGFGLGLGKGGTIFRGQFSMYRVKYPKALVEFPFFHAKYKNFQISQQQLQLSINDSNFFRRTIVNICTCKGDFGKFCFLQRAAFSGYL